MALIAWMALATIVGVDVPLSGVKEVGCSAMVETAPGAMKPVNDEGLKVLEQTATTADFAYDRENTRAIRCLRSDIVPAQNDYKVLGAGFPFYIVDLTNPQPRIGVLEVSGGQFRFRTIQGELTSDEMERLRIRLNQFQEATRNTH